MPSIKDLWPDRWLKPIVLQNRTVRVAIGKAPNGMDTLVGSPLGALLGPAPGATFVPSGTRP